MPIQNDDSAGLWEASPKDIRAELDLTNLVFQTVNMDVERATVSEAFKKQWRALYMEWADYAARHSGFFSRLRDEVYKRAIDYRNQAEKFRNALVKVKQPVTPVPSKTEGPPTPEKPKDEGLGILKWIFGIPLGFVVIKWLWNKAGKKTVLVQGPDGEMLELDAE